MLRELWPLLLAPVAGYLLDLLVGDPAWFYHPVRLIGGLIQRMEPPLRRMFPKTPAGERAGGVALALTVPLTTWLAAAVLCRVTLRAGVWGLTLCEAIFSCWLLATRSLRDESMAVHRCLERGDLPAARAAVARIVGRDVESLDEAGVTRAAVETVAENASDGVVAPLVFLMLGGSPLGWLYKAVNTLDSMVGYKNQRYRHFGSASARLDDVLNYLPSRFAALCMIAASAFTGFRAGEALRIWRRDRRNHTSPNSAQTESACAGALGIQLGGDAVYFGETHHKPTIGDADRPAEPQDIARANRLTLVSSILALLALLPLRLLALTLLFR